MTAIHKHTPDQIFGPLNEHERKHAPAEFHVAGDVELLRHGPRIAVVGSRKASLLGLERAHILVVELVRQGATIMSGLAEGIDTVAHRTALECGGRTIAVLGTPLDVYFPAHNRDLQLAIMREHLAVSQFASGTPTLPKHFPMRNRTMALLSDATIIVEAGPKSGTEHQAWEALRLGRSVFLLESLAKSEMDWTEKLVHYGARSLNRAELGDFVESLPTRSSGEAAPF